MNRNIDTSGTKISADIDLLTFLSKSAHHTSRIKAYLYLIGQLADTPQDVDKSGRTYHIEPGQILVSGTQLAETWNWDRKTVQSFLNGLQGLGHVTMKVVPYGQIITFFHVQSDSKVPQQ